MGRNSKPLLAPQGGAPSPSPSQEKSLLSIDVGEEIAAPWDDSPVAILNPCTVQACGGASAQEELKEKLGHIPLARHRRPWLVLFLYLSSSLLSP